MIAQEIIEQLKKLPDDILAVDMSIIEADIIEKLDTAHLDELRESLQFAEVNASLQAKPGKNDAERRLNTKQAIAESAECQELRAMLKHEGEQVARKAGQKATLSAQKSAMARKYHAMLAIAELISYQMAINAAKIQKEKIGEE